MRTSGFYKGYTACQMTPTPILPVILVSLATHGMELFTYARVIHDQQQLAHSSLPREGADVPPVSESLLLLLLTH